MAEKTKVAIACQGGGSQTAFTAGVLKSLFKNEAHKKNEIVALSGTSGGGVCAALAWFSMLKAARGDTAPFEQRLTDFWRDNSTSNMMEELLNASQVSFARLVDSGIMPEWKTSPGSPINQAMVSAYKAMFPRFYDFQRLLETYIKFKEIPGLVTPESPVLLLGAANVLTGEFKKFNSLKDEIQVESVLASAAVPSIFPAVEIGKDAYWDGLLSDNPPTDELVSGSFVGKDRIPDELWVIQINPREREKIPVTPEDIIDRRNEMIGNESLFQDLKHIMMVNKFLEKGAFKKAYIKEHGLKQVDIFTITMSEALMKTLDASSKLNRDAAYLDRLIEDGERRGEHFLQSPETMRYKEKI